ETLLGKRAKTRHLDGAFFYPRQGYGRIVERLAESCGRQNIRLNSRVTRLFHLGNRIHTVEINGVRKMAVDEVACSLPPGVVRRLLLPQPPADVLQIASQLRYRNVVLAAVFLAKERVSNNGSIYFPDAEIPFTRVYEPKNRSAEMCPEGCTSLVAEIPCQAG